ncbi:hypothetical protein Ga0609869_000582 [Rhodovulum iodosum]|uniref:Lipoprotein n=1 Tax=Rhodovulum iodosum TaxID=68291 RepID=A0ABV3XPI8_9RHOB|nr:hypothetical protein [Rhodovulum robiginosum]RSK31478.1 hypothetical protein EJA01_15180 [Rhodovulum robiginosum]
MTVCLPCAAALWTPAQAASPIAEIVCAPRAEMETRLKHRFGAVLQGVGLRGPDEVMELWSSPRSGDWTLVMRYAGGQSCIVAMGADWVPLLPDGPA